MAIPWFATTLVSLFILAGSVLVHTLTSGHWADGLAQLVPLLIFTPGLVLKQTRVYTWFCFTVLLYFCFYIGQLSANFNHPLMWLNLVSSIVLFVSAMMASRQIQREAFNKPPQ